MPTVTTVQWVCIGVIAALLCVAAVWARHWWIEAHAPMEIVRPLTPPSELEMGEVDGEEGEGGGNR